MAANVSKYIQAGNIASRQSLGIQSAAIQSGSDLSKISQEAQRQRIESEIAARRASATVYKAGMEGESRVRQTQNRYNPKEAKKSPLRKAGAVAAAGLVVGAAYKRRKDDKPSKKRTESQSYDFDARRSELEQELAASIKKSDELIAARNVKPLKTNVASTAPVSVDAQRLALRDTIYFGEGTWKGDSKQGQPMYNVAFGYNQFDNSKPHPGTVYSGEKVNSSAHGAGQFMPDTWQEQFGGKNVPMTPENQDFATLQLATQRGKYDFTKPFAEQAHNLSGIWASIPNEKGRSQYNLGDGTPQPSKSLQSLIDFHQERLKYYNSKS